MACQRSPAMAITGYQGKTHHVLPCVALPGLALQSNKTRGTGDTCWTSLVSMTVNSNERRRVVHHEMMVVGTHCYVKQCIFSPERRWIRWTVKVCLIWTCFCVQKCWAYFSVSRKRTVCTKLYIKYWIGYVPNVVCGMLSLGCHIMLFTTHHLSQQQESSWWSLL